MLRRCARLLLLALALAAGFAVLAYAHSEARIGRRYSVEVRAPTPSGDAASLERGRHLVTAVAPCTTCHGADLSGQVMADDPWLGRLYAPNLTPGRGGIAARSGADLVRSIRHGVKPDGRPLLLMPAQYLHRLSDDDCAAIVAYLRSLPPVDRVHPETRLGPLTRLVLLTGGAPDLIPAESIDHAAVANAPVVPAASAAYGAYLVETGGCRVCHRPDLGGGLHPLSLPGEPTPPDLTPEGPLANWSEDDFALALRTGRVPDGRRLDPAFMPWPAFAGLSDLELRAIWLYLRSLHAAQDRA